MKVTKQTLHLPLLKREATLYIARPDSLDERARYPVIYMHDGQNLFFAEDAYNQRPWNVQKALEMPGMPEVIVVGIDSPKDERRLDEYSPFVFEIDHARGGRGDQYIRDIKETVKPYIDAHYPTDPSPAKTALIGASMGGNISLYGLLAHPDTFTRAASLSGAFFTAPSAVKKWLSTVDFTHVNKLYMDCGDRENHHASSEDYLTTNGMVAAHITNILDNFSFRYEIIAGGTHNEDAWAQRIGGIIRYLFSD